MAYVSKKTKSKPRRKLRVKKTRKGGMSSNTVSKDEKKAISNALTADRRVAKGVASSAKKFLKDLEKTQKRKLSDAKHAVADTRLFFKKNKQLYEIVSNDFEIDDESLPFEKFCYWGIQHLSSKQYEDSISIFQQKAISTSPSSPELIKLSSDLYILHLGHIVKTKVVPHLKKANCWN